ncbi:MAG: polysaccharide deacetylase family protein [Acidobacteria bacterium]|nr:polysaccharide deacetylase family protein [Acidobacteriota bacterium]
MKEHLKKGYFVLQKILRRDAGLLRKIRREKLVTVLNLHQVSPHENPFWSPLRPEIFDDLLGFLKDRFEVVLFSELAAAPGEKPPAVLSFDDGYYNFLEFAAPLLKKHGLRANMNVIPSCVESGAPMWNVRLYDFLNSASRKAIDGIALPGFDHRLANESFAAKVRYGLKISRFLKNRPRLEREELWQRLEELIENAGFSRTRMMSRDEIREIAGTHEIGVHSYSHESMKFEEDAFFEDDFEKCVDYFKDKLELPLEIYAFPNGSYRPEQVAFLQNRGIRHILLVGEDYAPRGTNVYPRFTLYGASKIEARFQALGFNRKI